MGQLITTRKFTVVFCRFIFACLNNYNFKKPVLACYPTDRTATHLGSPKQFFLCMIALDDLEDCVWDFQMYFSSVSSGSFCASRKSCTCSPCVAQSEDTSPIQGMLLRALTLTVILQESS